jgi:hypothetical protein
MVVQFQQPGGEVGRLFLKNLPYFDLELVLSLQVQP